MITLIRKNIDLIKDVCKKHHVRSLYLIGSAADNEKDFTEASDIDFLYRFKKDEIGEMDYADNYFNFLFALQDLLRRNIDLVPEEKLKNPFFINSINKNKQVVYEFGYINSYVQS